MKRILAFFLALCICLALAACGKAPADSGGTTPGSLQDTRVPTTEGTAAATTATEATGDTAPEETVTPTEPQQTTPANPTEPTTPAEPTVPSTVPAETTPATEPAAPHSHSYSGKVTKAAGCTAKGVKTYSCSCGSSYTQDIAPTGHSWGEWVTTKAPTTTEAGNAQRKCKNCSATENQTLAKLPDPTPTGNAVTQAQLDQIYDYFLMLVNMERTRVGVGTLTSNAYLDSCAQIRSNETLESFSHTRPDGQPWVTVLDMNSYPYTIAGENLCMTSHVGSGSYTAADKWVGSQEQIEAAAGWIFILFKESPGHYANMIHESYTECGIGISCRLYEGTDIPMFYLAHIFADR